MIFAVLVVRVYHVVLTPSFKLLSFLHLLVITISVGMKMQEWKYRHDPTGL